MFCPNCGYKNAHDDVFCAECGTKLMQETMRFEAPAEPAPEQAAPQSAPVSAPEPRPVPPQVSFPTEEVVTPRIPPEYRPLSPWAYFGMALLYSIPFAGFVLLIVMSFAPRNKNLKNFTRAYWCAALVVLAIAVIVVVLAVALGVSVPAISEYLR